MHKIYASDFVWCIKIYKIHGLYSYNSAGCYFCNMLPTVIAEPCNTSLQSGPVCTGYWHYSHNVWVPTHSIPPASRMFGLLIAWADIGENIDASVYWLYPTVDDVVQREEPQHLKPWWSLRQVVVGLIVGCYIPCSINLYGCIGYIYCRNDFSVTFVLVWVGNKNIVIFMKFDFQNESVVKLSVVTF